MSTRSDTPTHNARGRIIGLSLTLVAVMAMALAGLGPAALAAPKLAASGPGVQRLNVKGAQGQTIHLTPPPPARNQRALAPAPPANSHLDYNGGPVVHSLTAYTIFWQPAGYHFEEAYKSGTTADAHDTSYETLIDRFFKDVGATPFLNILTQYSDTSDSVHNSLTFGGQWVDKGAFNQFAASDTGTQANPVLDSDIQSEVRRAISHNPTWSKSGLGAEFFVFTPAGVQSCTTSGQTFCDGEYPYPADAYCAYHSAFYNSSNQPLLYANMFDAGYSWACGGPNWASSANGPKVGPIDGPGPNGDSVADYEISPMSHEMSETITDALPNSGWEDNSDRDEVGDICAYDFFPKTKQNGDVILHGHQYLIQTEWSNTGGAQNAGRCDIRYSRPATLYVNSKADSVPANGLTPLCPNTPGGDAGSNSKYFLRCAINDANDDALAGTFNHSINFTRCGTTCSISLASAPPNLQATGLTLDGGGHTTINGHNAIASGLRVMAPSTTVEGLTVENLKASAVLVAGNSKHVTIGGTEPNTFIQNTGYGVVVGSSKTDTSDAVISKNVMYGNTAGGISLLGLPIASCSSGTGAGPNGHLACPTITTALPAVVAGTSSCDKSCTVQLFAVPTTADKSGHGQAKTFVGSGATTATGTWTVSPTATLTAGEKLTATVTHTTAGETSEFATNVAVS